MRKMRTWGRVVLGGIGCLGVFLFSPWVPLAAIVISSFFFRAWEAIAIGLLMDLMYLPPLSIHSPIHNLPLFTVSAIAIVWLLEPLRREMLY